MTATTTKAVKATLDFSIQVQVSVQATEAKWKKVTKEYRDPNESWADEAESVINSFVEYELQCGYLSSPPARRHPSPVDEI